MRRLRQLLLTGSLVALLLAPFALFVPRVAAVDPLGQSCQQADPSSVSAVCQDNTQQAINKPNPLFGPGGILTTVINILSLIAAVIAVFVIIIAGVKMITSSGNSETVSSARRTIIYAVISLAIVASAQLMVHFVLSKL